MTILDAIQTAIDQLEGVILPIRDADNANRVRYALSLLDALKETVEKNSKQSEPENSEGGDEP